MKVRYWERRRHIRVPVGGPVRWHSGGRSGQAWLVDLSPGGAGLRLAVRGAAQLGPRVRLEVDLGGGRSWALAEDARVVRRTAGEDGECVAGVQFESTGGT